MPIILLFRVCHACISLVLVPTVFFFVSYPLVLSAKNRIQVVIIIVERHQKKKGRRYQRHVKIDIK